VVLGGDSSSGLPLILELERKGYVVITSVSTPEAVGEIERRCHGYVRALVLDPAEPDAIPYFLRSLSSTLSRRFPITAAGDPHTSPSSHLHVHSVISLLTLPASDDIPSPAPLEHISLRDDYASYLQTTHITPLQILQAMMPLLRTTPARARDAISNNRGKKSIVVCLPVTDARVGVPFASMQAMSAAATLRGVEVLRREIHMAALTDASESMKNIKVVIVDVGAVSGPNPVPEIASDVEKNMDDWTPSEKVAYGTAFTSVVEKGLQVGVHRKPTDVAVFVNTIVDVVSNGQRSGNTTLGAAVRLGFGRIREWIRGDRVLVGAGARTYALASYLPARILDTILNIPHLLVSIRNALLPVPPRVVLPDAPIAPPVPPPTIILPAQKPESEAEEAIDSDPEHQQDASETGSEADVESNEGYGSGVGESWISLRDE